ncbi:MAG: hypothetical protein R6V11_06055 [Ectothiorhodospiraceae bacterium]
MHRTLTALVMLALLGGCASTNDTNDADRVERGRAAYEGGNYGEAFEQLLVAAENGDPGAQYTVGYMYYEGQGVSQDEERALRWIERAAANGSPHAIEALSELASLGERRPGRERSDPAGPDPESRRPQPPSQEQLPNRSGDE